MTAMKRYMIIIIACLAVVSAHGQEVTFLSPEVEGGVRQHLGFTESQQIGFAQLDTITTLDLSRRGITDVRDLVLMPKLRTLDLSDNSVEDLQPIAVLDSLEWVDLSYNGLKGINDLFFSSAKSMTVNVAFNHIRDFSLFGSISSCRFILEGTGLQLNDHPLYFDVYDFYADVNNEGVPMVSYRGFTNVEGDVSLECGSTHVAASMDGDTYSVLLPEGLSLTTQATLSNGEVGDTTWVVPPTAYDVTNGGEVTISTGLPENYRIGYLRALHGMVDADGTTLHYVAPTRAVNDTLYLSYYENEQIKGFTELYIKAPQTATDMKDIPQELPLLVSLDGNVLRVAGLSKGVTAVKVYDALGRLLVVETPDKGQDLTIRLPGKHAVVIVEVTCGKRRIVKKISK